MPFHLIWWQRLTFLKKRRTAGMHMQGSIAKESYLGYETNFPHVMVFKVGQPKFQNFFLLCVCSDKITWSDTMYSEASCPIQHMGQAR